MSRGFRSATAHQLLRAAAALSLAFGSLAAFPGGALAAGGGGFKVDSQSLLVTGGPSSSANFRVSGCLGYTPSGMAQSGSFRMAAGCGAGSFIAGLPTDEVQMPGPLGIVTVIGPQSGCGPLLGVNVVPGPLPNADPGFSYDLGQVSFDVSCAPTGGTTTVTVLFRGAAPAHWPPVGWRSFGPLPPGGTGPKAFYPLASVKFGTIPVPGEGDVPAAYVTVTDGATGDDTAVDGRIVSLGGPVFAAESTAIPALGTAGLGILAAALAVAGIGALGAFGRPGAR
jgi:hypothetical protein